MGLPPGAVDARPVRQRIGDLPARMRDRRKRTQRRVARYYATEWLLCGEGHQLKTATEFGVPGSPPGIEYYSAVHCTKS